MPSCTAVVHQDETVVPEEISAGRPVVERLTDTAPGVYSATSGAAGSTGEFTPQELLREGSSFLEELHRFILQTAELYRAGNEQEGSGSFIELTHGLEWFVTLTAAAQQLPGFAPQPATTGLNDILMDMVAAQEQQDMVLLTDLLEYELAPQIRSWLETFTTLRDSNEGR